MTQPADYTANLNARFVDDADLVRTGRALIEVDGYGFMIIPVPDKWNEQVQGVADGVALVRDAITSARWDGDRLTILGATSGPLTGEQGDPGPRGDRGPEGPLGPAGVVVSTTRPEHGEVWIDPSGTWTAEDLGIELAGAGVEDSGWYDLTEFFTVTSGRVLARRVGAQITYRFDKVGASARGFIANGTLPTQWIGVNQNHAVNLGLQGPGMGEAPVWASIHMTGGRGSVFVQGTIDPRRGHGEACWLADTAFPATFPGTKL